MTVLEACVEVLQAVDGPLKTRELLSEINSRQLYAFKARDPLKVVGGAIRNNLKHGHPPLLEEVAQGTYKLAQLG